MIKSYLVSKHFSLGKWPPKMTMGWGFMTNCNSPPSAFSFLLMIVPSLFPAMHLQIKTITMHGIKQLAVLFHKYCTILNESQLDRTQINITGEFLREQFLCYVVNLDGISR